MKVKKKYTYKDWYDGKVVLSSAAIYSNKGKKPVIVDWSDFNTADIISIKKAQKELFDDAVDKMLNSHQEQFTERFNLSRFKSKFINDEIQQCYDIMYGELVTDQYVHLRYWENAFTIDDFFVIRNFIECYLKKGIVIPLDFIHSPNSKFHDKNRFYNEVYGMFIIEYNEWLNSFRIENQKKLNVDDVKLFNTEKEQSNALDSDPSINPIEYFKNKENLFNNVPLIQVYKYFMQLVDETHNSFLNKVDVLSFVDKAFCGNKSIQPITMHNIKNKQSVIFKLFYNFYADCTTDSTFEKTKQTKPKYVKLITDNFDNWKYKTVYDNFSKSDSKYWKRLSEFK